MLNLTVRALSISSGKRSMLFCKNAAIQYNRTLLGGYEAGEFKLLSTSIDMSACIRLCCSDVTCDVAFMIEVKCYGVLCKTEKLCKAIPAKTSSLLQYLSPKLSYITNRNEQGTYKQFEEKESVACIEKGSSQLL